MQIQLDDLMAQIEHSVAAAVQRGLQRGIAGTNAIQSSIKVGKARVVKAARTLAGTESCSATGCSKPVRTKGLCAAHYQKAHRLEIKGPNYTQAQKDTLGADGRAERFKNKASA